LWNDIAVSPAVAVLPIPRLVIVEPAYASTVGHHGEVNRPLLAALGQAGWSCELWADVALEGETTAPQPLRGVFSGCGYGGPRQWRELGGALVLARRLEQQLAALRRCWWSSRGRPGDATDARSPAA